MKKKTAHKAHISRVLTAVLVGVIAVPTAMTGLFAPADSDDTETQALMQDITRTAINDAGRIRYVRRNYWTAVDVYNELTRLGYEGLIPPNINKPNSIAYYLDSENFDLDEQDILHGSAPVDPDYLVTVSQARHEYNMLPEMWRDLIDGYINTQFCAPTLSQYNVYGQEDVDIYDLCVRLLDERIAAVTPNLLDRSAYLRGFNRLGFAPIRTLRNRLQILEESLLFEGGTSTRPRYHDGHRPRLDYSQYRN